MEAAIYSTQAALDYICRVHNVLEDEAVKILILALHPDVDPGKSYSRWRTPTDRPQHINDVTADEWAVALGVHPTRIWGDEWWDAPEAKGLLGTAEVARTAGVKNVSLRTLVHEGRHNRPRSRLRGLPEPIRLRVRGPGAQYRLVWEADEFDAWFAEREAS
jgi:hypothetical protein